MQNERISARASAGARPHQKVLDALRSGPRHVYDIADETGAIPFDIKDVHYSHRGDECTFDTLISEFGLSDPALLHLARIVRGADTDRLDLAPQSAGLLALSLGLSAMLPDDDEMLAAAMPIYDALYAWCASASSERHAWQPGA